MNKTSDCVRTYKTYGPKNQKNYCDSPEHYALLVVWFWNLMFKIVFIFCNTLIQTICQKRSNEKRVFRLIFRDFMINVCQNCQSVTKNYDNYWENCQNSGILREKMPIYNSIIFLNTLFSLHFYSKMLQ